MRINKEGYRIILMTFLIVGAITACGFVFLHPWAAWLIGAALFLKFLFILYFFRDPKREIFKEEDIVYAPADGKVVVVEQIEEKEYLGEKRIQVSIFMSIWNVHVNRFPVAGRILYFRHHQGKYLIARNPKSSELNERTTTVIDTGRYMILFRQIAGYVARRIVSYAAEGIYVEQNSHCGFIKFGSRMDIMLPLDCEILVIVGDKVKGSQTPIARLK